MLISLNSPIMYFSSGKVNNWHDDVMVYTNILKSITYVYCRYFRDFIVITS